MCVCVFAQHIHLLQAVNKLFTSTKSHKLCETCFNCFKSYFDMTVSEYRYEKSWEKSNKTKLLQDGLERAGRRDLAEKIHCLHWGHQKLSRRVELPSAFPFLITVHKTIHNQEGLRRINDLNCRYTHCK